MEEIVPPHALTERELEVLSLMAHGYSNAEIANDLFLALTTVKWYARQINQKLGVNSRTKAVAKANKYKLLGQQEHISPKSTTQHNLPAQTLPFIGRKREYQQVLTLLRSSRLVTLTGIGGSGKTRLALEIAHTLTSEYKDGVWSIFLAALSDASLLVKTIAKVLNISETPTESLKSTIIRFLKNKQLLLLFDNFEHILDSATIISDLLDGIPQLSILVTSREVLNIYGEHEYQVPPLEVPQLDKDISASQFSQIESIQLFLQSARAISPDFTLTKANQKIIAQICTKLEGLPLSIELSVARLRIFSLEELLLRLENRLLTLVGGAQNLPNRQRTLRATIEWSYKLLTPEEQSLFEHIALLRNGCTLNALNTIFVSSYEYDTWELLESLIRKNLILQNEGMDGRIRFYTLETLREYAIEQLHLKTNYDPLYEKYSQYYAERLTEIEPHLRGDRYQYQWFDYLEVEHNNIHEILEWVFINNHILLGLELTSNLIWYWWRREYNYEGLSWIKRSIDKIFTTEVNDILKARLYLGLGILEWATHDRNACIVHLNESIKLSERVDDLAGNGWGLIFKAIADVGDKDTYISALQDCDKGINLLRQAEVKTGVAQGLNIKGELTRGQGDYISAKKAYQDCMAIVHDIGDVAREKMVNTNLGFIAVHEQDYTQAQQFFTKSLTLSIEHNKLIEMPSALAGLGGLFAVQEQWINATELMAIATAINNLHNANFPLGDVQFIEDHLELIKLNLDAQTFDIVWQRLLALPPPDMLQFITTTINKLKCAPL